jgi:hypothetical protein
MAASKQTSTASESKLLSVLSGFTRQELQRFRDYIASSYSSNQDLLLQIFDTLVPMLNSDGSKVTRGRQIVKLLFKTAQYGTAPYKTLFADLLKLAQTFAARQGYDQAPQKAVKDVLKAVNARRLDKLFDINLSLAQKIRSNVSNRSAAQHLREFVIATELDLHRRLSQGHKQEPLPAHTIELVDVFYLVNKLRYHCVQKQGADADKDPLHKEVIELALSGRYDHIASVLVYATIYRMLHEEDESHFERLKVLLKEQQRELPDVILRDAYVFAINYCVRQVNHGKFNYLRDVYELYTIAIDKNFLYDEHELSAWDISNIMALGLQLRDYKWSEKLIEVYKERVPAAAKMNVVTYNMAKMYFFGGRYEDVLKLLAGVKADDAMYVTGTHALLIKTYYETGDQDALHDAITRFKAVLKRRKSIPADERDSYLQFLEILTSIMQLTKSDKKGHKELKQLLKDKPDIAEAEWLLEKL